VASISAKTSHLLDLRSYGLCEVCGNAWASNTHHRRPRGMGGSKDPATNSVVNLLRCCGSGTVGCHGLIEANREQSYDLGLLVRRTVSDIAAVPVKLHHGWCLLTQDGLYGAVPPPLDLGHK
jgi:5-methylcytosine-specific restriction enzyme A